jgi:erythromycin esterase-like protein
MSSHTTLDDWMARDAIPFSVDSPESIDAGVDRVIRSLGDSLQLLGFGEALHGSEEILVVRNRLFQRLVEGYGYSAVVIEVTSPQARVMNDYVLDLRSPEDQAVQDWFGDGFGQLEANRELIEWMREYNADPAHPVKLHFYGFDLPLGQGGLASPSRVLDIVLDYLDSIDGASSRKHRDRVTPLVGDDAGWERPAAMFDPSQSVGSSSPANELRIATEDLITELRIRRPELVAKSDKHRYADALHHAKLIRKLLNAHAALAKPDAYSEMLGIRDLIMADNLEYIVSRESDRGMVLVFAANGHLKKSGNMRWQLAEQGGALKEWWPAGTHLNQMLGSRYAMIGMALGASEANGIGQPEPGTLEARLTKAGGALFIPTHQGRGLPAAEIAALPIRSGGTLNPTYGQLTAESFTDFDWLVVFDSTAYPRGAAPLSNWNAG